MKSLTHYILLAGGLILGFIVLSAVGAAASIANLRQESQRLVDTVLIEQRLQGQFQVAIYQTVAEAYEFARTQQRDDFQDARNGLTEAQELLPTLADIASRSDTNGSATDLQEQRVALVADAERQLARLEEGVASNDATLIGLALQRLDLVAQDASTSVRLSNRLLDEKTQLTVTRAEQTFQLVIISAVSGFIILITIVFLVLLLIRRWLVVPLRLMLRAVHATAAGDLSQNVEVTSRHEVGQLQTGLNAMITSLRHQRTVVAEYTASLEQANQKQRELLETINALSAPILPVLPGVLVLPIVGHVDQRRADLLMTTLLDAVHEQHTRQVILDITGLVDLDPMVLQRLIQMMNATELLGAHVYVAGVSPKFAQAIVQQRDSRIALRSYRNLRDAIETLLATELLASTEVRM